jgi:hypothetical protein
MKFLYNEHEKCSNYTLKNSEKNKTYSDLCKKHKSPSTYDFFLFNQEHIRSDTNIQLLK